MSTAMAREMLMSRRSFDQRNSQLRSSLVTTVPVRNRRLSAFAAIAGDFRHRLLQGDLHFGQSAGIGVISGTASSRMLSRRR